MIEIELFLNLLISVHGNILPLREGINNTIILNSTGTILLVSIMMLLIIKNGIYMIRGENNGWANDNLVDDENGNYDYLMYDDIDFKHPEVR